MRLPENEQSGESLSQDWLWIRISFPWGIGLCYHVHGRETDYYMDHSIGLLSHELMLSLNNRHNRFHRIRPSPALSSHPISPKTDLHNRPLSHKPHTTSLSRLRLKIRTTYHTTIRTSLFSVAEINVTAKIKAKRWIAQKPTTGNNVDDRKLPFPQWSLRECFFHCPAKETSILKKERK